MIAIPRRVAMPITRVRNFRVGMPAMVRRSRLPRCPRPKVSRPVARASAKLRFSTTIAEQFWCCPLVAPLLIGHTGGIEVVAVAPQPFPAHRNRRAPRSQRLFGGGQPGPQHHQTAGLGEPLRDTHDTGDAATDRWCRCRRPAQTRRDAARTEPRASPPQRANPRRGPPSPACPAGTDPPRRE